MAPPPTYIDLGKRARDLFAKGYNYGLVKLEYKTKLSKFLDDKVSEVSAAPNEKKKFQLCGAIHDQTSNLMTKTDESLDSGVDITATGQNNMESQKIDDDLVKLGYGTKLSGFSEDKLSDVPVTQSEKTKIQLCGAIYDNSSSVKTKSGNNFEGSGMEIIATGQNNMDSQKISGNLETKYKFPNMGVTLVEKWHTDNVLSSEVTVEDKFKEGLKLSFDAAFSPNTGKKSGVIKSAFKNDMFHVGCDVELAFAGPLFHCFAVMGYKGFLGGHQMTVDTARRKIARNNVTLGYATDELEITTKVNDWSEFSGTLYQRVSSSLEAGLTMSWSSITSHTRFALGGKYIIDKENNICGKINNTGQLGLGYSVAVREGIKFTVSSLVELTQLHHGGHKLGLGLEFQV